MKRLLQKIRELTIELNELKLRVEEEDDDDEDEDMRMRMMKLSSKKSVIVH